MPEVAQLIAAAAALSPVSTPLMSRLSAGSIDSAAVVAPPCPDWGTAGVSFEVWERARHAQGLLLGDNGVMRMMTVFRLGGGGSLGQALSGSAAQSSIASDICSNLWALDRLA